MKIAAYCRVSTDKADQLNSLEAQKEFFYEYTQRTGDVLEKLYADEGISGTKIKNLKELIRMMEDAEKGMFDNFNNFLFFCLRIFILIYNIDVTENKFNTER